MNEDASAGLNDNVTLAAKIPILSTIGLWILIVGIIGFAVGIIMIYF